MEYKAQKIIILTSTSLVDAFSLALSVRITYETGTWSLFHWCKFTKRIRIIKEKGEKLLF